MQQYTHSHSLALISIAASEDVALLSQWESHLRPLEQAGLISVWSGQHLAPGADRVQAFQQQLDTANIVLLLLSADFFNSPDCLAMMAQALLRSRTDKVPVIPLLLRSVAWQESPLAELTLWPSNSVPITQWSDQDAAWDACVLDLRRLLGRRVSPALPGGSASKHTDHDWERMLRRLRRSYKELLDQSLHGLAWVELGLASQPDMVSNVTNLLFRLPRGGERLLAPGTSILDAYDEAEEELLILGAPGAGKSTLLLDLAQQLVGRALADPTHPLPVILRLSSWAVERLALADWMVEQLSRIYDVPRALSERWVKQGHLLPLLDGLDEMEEAAHPAMIVAINEYHRTYLTSLVVSSRQAEYETAVSKQRLALQGAVIVQPLSEVQVTTTLQEAGPSFAGLQEAWSQEPTLRELATTPLMLSVQLLAYRGVPASEILQRGEERERQVWADYVKRQVTEKGNNVRYTLERTYTWLTFFARQMRLHQQTTFYAEYLDTDWLPSSSQRIVTLLATHFPAILIGACACLLVFILLGAPALNGVYIDLMSAIQWGLIGGSVGLSMSQMFACAARPYASSRTLKQLISSYGGLAVVLGGLLLISFLPIPIDDAFSSWGGRAYPFDLGAVLSLWIFQRALSHPQGPSGQRKSKRTIWYPFSLLMSMAPIPVWQAAIYLGGGLGLSVVLSDGLSFGQVDGLSFGLEFGMSFGVSFFIAVILVFAVLKGSAKSLRFTESIHWIGHRVLQQEHLWTSVTIASALFLFLGLIGGLNQGLNVDLSTGLSFGLSQGLTFGLIGGLSYLFLVGLYQGIRQEHLEDQNRHQFNQGIRRSLHNGLLLAVISASIITTFGALSVGLSVGLSIGQGDGLSFGLNEGLSSISTFFPTSLVLMWAISSGLTVLRHYVIRWLLARHRIFPWRAHAFLDDATTRILLRRVGGGYSFIHRRLQDYFADAEVPPPQQ